MSFHIFNLFLLEKLFHFFFCLLLTRYFILYKIIAKPDFSSIVYLKFYYSKLSQIYRVISNNQCFIHAKLLYIISRNNRRLKFLHQVSSSHIFVKDAIHRAGNRFRFSSAKRNSAFVTMRVSLLSHRGNTIHENFTNFVFVRRNNTKLEREYCTSLNVAFETSPFSSDSKESDFSEKIVQRKEYVCTFPRKNFWKISFISFTRHNSIKIYQVLYTKEVTSMCDMIFRLRKKCVTIERAIKWRKTKDAIYF